MSKVNRSDPNHKKGWWPHRPDSKTKPGEVVEFHRYVVGEQPKPDKPAPGDSPATERTLTTSDAEQADLTDSISASALRTAAKLRRAAAAAQANLEAEAEARKPPTLTLADLGIETIGDDGEEE